MTPPMTFSRSTGPGVPTEPAVFGLFCASKCTAVVAGPDSLRRAQAAGEKEAKRVREERDRQAARQIEMARARAYAAADAERAELLQRAAARKADQLREYRALGWSEDDIALIKAGRIRIGFTARQVRESVGGPDRINTTVTPAGTHEQWVYGDNYVYLTNGVVTAFQTSR
jgi:acyl-CoA reductase-like NAD-dependent aldehyde dehydrogenase